MFKITIQLKRILNLAINISICHVAPLNVIMKINKLADVLLISQSYLFLLSRLKF